MKRLKQKSLKPKRTRLKQGDMVTIICGKDKGEIGVIIAIKRSHDRVRAKIKDLNLVSKHKRPNPQANESATIVKEPAWIDISNVMFYDAENNKRGRMGVKIIKSADNKDQKIRCYKKDRQLIEIEGQ